MALNTADPCNSCQKCRLFGARLKMADSLIKTLQNEEVLLVQERDKLHKLYSEMCTQQLIRLAHVKRELTDVKTLVNDLTASNNSVLVRVQGTLYQLEGVMRKSDNPDLSKILAKVTRMNLKLEDDNEALADQLQAARSEIRQLQKLAEDRQKTIDGMKAEFSSCQLERKKMDQVKMAVDARKEQLDGQERDLLKERQNMARMHADLVDRDRRFAELQAQLRKKDRALFLIKGALYDKQRNCGASKLPSDWVEIERVLCTVDPTRSSDLDCVSTPSDAVDLQGSPIEPKRSRVSTDEQPFGNFAFGNPVTSFGGVSEDKREVAAEIFNLRVEVRHWKGIVQASEKLLEQERMVRAEAEARATGTDVIRADLEGLKTKISGLSALIKHQEMELTQQKQVRELTAQQLTNTQSVVQQLRKTIVASEAQLELKTKENELFTAQLAQLNAEKKIQASQVEQIESKVASLSQTVVMYETTISGLTSELAERDERISTLELKLAIDSLRAATDTSHRQGNRSQPSDNLPGNHRHFFQAQAPTVQQYSTTMQQQQQNHSDPGPCFDFGR